MAYKCIESWRKYFPDWEIRLWNEHNSPMEHPYMQKAYSNNKWSNLSNYTRLFAIKNFGGIYFDTDVEVIKRIDFLDKYSCFVGFESEPYDHNLSVNNAILGAEKDHPFIEQCFQKLQLEFDGTEVANFSSPVLTTNVLLKNGLKEYGEQDVQNVHVFDMKTFYPYAWDDLFTYGCVTDKTYTIHYWDMSWKDNEANSKELQFQLKGLKKYIVTLEKRVRDLQEGEIAIKEWLKINIKFLGKLLIR